MKDDHILYWTTEAVNYAREYEEISVETYFSEKADQLQVKQDSNTKATNGFVTAMKNAVASIRQLISDIMTSISNAIQKIFMSKEEKDLLKRYEEEIRKEPGKANQKVKVTDFKKLDKAYMDALRKAEKAYQDGADPKLSEEIIKALKVSLGASTVAAGVGVAVNICKSSPKLSQAVSNALQREDSLLTALENTIGKDAAADIKNASDKYSKKMFWSRFKVNLFRRKNQDILGGHKKTMSAIGAILKNDGSPESNAAKMRAAADLLDNPVARKVASTGLRAGAKMEDIKGGAKNFREKHFGGKKKGKSKEELDQAKQQYANNFNKVKE